MSDKKRDTIANRILDGLLSAPANRVCRTCGVSASLEVTPVGYKKRTNKTAYHSRCKKCISTALKEKKHAGTGMYFFNSLRHNAARRVDGRLRQTDVLLHDDNGEDYDFAGQTKKSTKAVLRRFVPTSEELVEQSKECELCPRCGHELKYAQGDAWTASLDRCDREKPYYVDKDTGDINYIITCVGCNTLRQCLTEDEFKAYWHRLAAILQCEHAESFSAVDEMFMILATDTFKHCRRFTETMVDEYFDHLKSGNLQAVPEVSSSIAWSDEEMETPDGLPKSRKRKRGAVQQGN